MKGFTFCFSLILTCSIFAQDNYSNEPLRKLESELPQYEISDFTHESNFVELSTPNAKFKKPHQPVPMTDILNSPLRNIAIKKNATLIRIENEENLILPKNILTKVYALPDENEYFYIPGKQNEALFRVNISQIEPIELVTRLYVPPNKFRLSTVDKTQTQVDPKPFIYPEINFGSGLTQALFTQDLYNDGRAKTAPYIQYGLTGWMHWQKAFSLGATSKIERSYHSLRGNSRATFTAFSIGPVFRTSSFVVEETPFYFQAQTRWSPVAHTQFEDLEKINLQVNNLQISLEFPQKNRWGEFLFGVAFGRQWINLKENTKTATLDTDNNTNDLYMITLSQGFF